MAKTKGNAEVENQGTLFSKEQILNSKKYANRRDVLGAILSDEKTYTVEKVDSLLNDFMKGKVK